MQEILLVVNDSPYGSEKAYNALRTAMNLQKKDEDVQINIFLLDDGVVGAKANQQTPKGYYNVERMFKAVLRKGGFVKT